MSEGDKKHFTVVLGSHDVRVVFGDTPVKYTASDVVLTNPDLSAVKGLAPHQWAHQDSQLVRRSQASEPVARQRSKALQAAVALGVVLAFVAMHMALKHYGY